MKKKTALVVSILACSAVFIAPIFSAQAFSLDWLNTSEPVPVPVPEPEPEPAQNPIVFVHGFMGGPTTGLS